MELLYYTWELFTMDERNAWWLMMVVFAFTCITFIYTNVKMRVHLKKISQTQKTLLTAMWLLSEGDKKELQLMVEQEEES